MGATSEESSECTILNGVLSAGTPNRPAVPLAPASQSCLCLVPEHRQHGLARGVNHSANVGLRVTAAERDAMTRILATCPAMGLPGPGSASTVAALPRTANALAPQPAPALAPPAGAISYANCTAVRAAGAAPIHRGDPGYASKLDRDGDGIGCE